MIALLMAAVVTSGPLAAPPRAGCAAEGRLQTRGPAPALLLRPGETPRARKLGDMPRAHLMLPVVRKVDGCSVSTVLRHDVQGDGRFGR